MSDVHSEGHIHSGCEERPNSELVWCEAIPPGRKYRCARRATVEVDEMLLCYQHGQIVRENGPGSIAESGAGHGCQGDPGCAEAKSWPEFRPETPSPSTSAALIDLARLLLTPAALDADEWVKGRIRWHRLDGNDELVVEMLSKENSIRSAIGKEPLDV